MFGCLDTQLCESCSSEDKPGLLNWNHLVRFNLLSFQDPRCCTRCTRKPGTTGSMSTVFFITYFKRLQAQGQK